MKMALRRFVYVGHVVLVSAAWAALANCGAGERPPPEANDPVDGSTGTPSTDGAASGVTVLGYDPVAGISFGDNGLVNCGSQATDRLIMFSNTTGDIVNFKAKLTSGDKLYKLNPEEGGIPAYGQSAVQIIPSPIPQESDVSPDLYAGTLEVQFSTGAPPTVIRLHQTARGAIINTTITNSLVDFGDVKVATTGTQQFSITNSGNVQVTANFALGSSSFKIDGAQTAVVPLGAGETASKTLTLAPADTIAYSDTLALTFNSSAVHCKLPPTAANVKGKGTTSVGVSPGTLDFGQVDCGKVASPKKVTIKSTAAMSFTPVLLKGVSGTSPYKVYNDADGVEITGAVAMAAASEFALRVVPQTIASPASTAANAFGDTLRIDTTAPGDVPHNVVLNQTARGAVFAFDPTSFTVKDPLFGHSSVRAFKVKNTGNNAASYDLAVVPKDASSAGKFEINLLTDTLIGGGEKSVNLTTISPDAPDAGTAQQYFADIVLTPKPDAVLCADPPPNVNIIVEH